VNKEAITFEDVVLNDEWIIKGLIKQLAYLQGIGRVLSRGINRIMGVL
jgi:aldehyde:ferredoxin oxidoreductase